MGRTRNTPCLTLEGLEVGRSRALFARGFASHAGKSSLTTIVAGNLAHGTLESPCTAVYASCRALKRLHFTHLAVRAHEKSGRGRGVLACRAIRTRLDAGNTFVFSKVTIIATRLPDERLGFAGLADIAGRKTGDTRIGAHCAVRTHCRSRSALYQYHKHNKDRQLTLMSTAKLVDQYTKQELITHYRVSPGGAVDASGRGRASHILANCARHTTRQAANSSVSADGTARA